MKKRTIATILTCAMTAALLAGCSGSDKTQTTAASESETAAEPSEEATEAAAEAQSEEAGSKADTGAEHADAPFFQESTKNRILDFMNSL